MRFNTEKWKKANHRRGIAYRILQGIMGIALAIILICLATIASLPDWSVIQWTLFFMWVGISGGVGLTAWLAATLIGWSERGEK